MGLSADALKRGPGPQQPLTVSLVSDSSLSVGRGYRDLQRKGEIARERYHERVKAKLKPHLKDIIADLPIDGDDDNVRVTVPPSRRPKFQRSDTGHKGYGSGNGQEGDVVFPGPDSRHGRRGGHGEVTDAEDIIEIPARDLWEMAYRDLELPDIDETKAVQMEAKTVHHTDIRKGRIAPWAVKRIMLEALKRQAMQTGSPYEKTEEVGEDGEVITHKRVKIKDPEDMRHLTWDVVEEPKTSCVVFVMRDVSGSMGPDEAYALKVLISHTKRFLKTKYDNVVIVYGIHHSEVRMPVEEEYFFHPTESGGTDLIPALDKMHELAQKYPEAEWNRYTIYGGDGQIFEDPEQVQDRLRRLRGDNRRVFYAQTNIRSGDAISEYKPPLEEAIEAVNDDGSFIVAKINDKDQVGKAFRHFFAKREGGVSRA